MSYKYPPFQTSLRTRLLFKYPVFLLGRNQDCYLNILYFYLTQTRTAIQILSIPTQHLTQTAIQISSISTWKKSGQLFRYPLFLPDLRLGLLFRYPLFLFGKNLDFYSDVLDFSLTQIGTAIQVSFIPTRPKTETAIQIPSVSNWQKSLMQSIYPLSQPDTKQDCFSNILCSYLA